MHILVFSFAALLQSPGQGEAWRIIRDAQHSIDSGTSARFEKRWQSAGAADRRSLLAGATLARLRYQYERADSLNEQLIRLEHGVGEFSAAAHLGQAFAKTLGTDVVGADTLFSRARAETPDWHVAFQALIGLGKLRSRRVGPKTGLELVRQARALADHPTAEEAAQGSCIEGALLEQLGDSAGRKLILDGIRIARRANTLRELGACDLLMAQTTERIGYFESVVVYARQAVNNFQKTHHLLGVAAAGQWLGYAELVRGYFSAAQLDLERAVQASQTTRFGSVEAWARADLADLYLTLGDGESARDQAERAAKLHTAYGDLWGFAVDLQFQGVAAQSHGRTDDACVRFSESVAAFRRAGLGYNALGSMRLLALANMTAGRLDSAQRVLDEATRLARASGNTGWLNEAPVHLARLAMLRGDLRAADSLIAATSSHYSWRQSNDDLLYVQFAALEAQVALRMQRPATADSAASFIASTIATRRQAIGDRDLRAGLAQLRNDWGGLSEAYPDIVAGLAASGRVASAFRFIESVRAREIADAALRAIGRIRDSSAALLEFRRVEAAAPAVSVDDVRRRMPGDEALVVLTLGSGPTPTTAIVVTKDSTTAISLPSREVVGPLIERYVRVAVAGSEPIAVSRQLGAALLQPVVRVLPSTVTRLAISPDGDLYRVPFDALRLADDHFAVERYAISLIPSATVGRMVRALPTSPRATRLIAIGDPAFARPRPVLVREESFGARASDQSRFGGLTLARLPQSASEVRRVAAYATEGAIWTGDAATETAVRTADWRNVGVVHFATHALVDAEGQSRTALALTPSGADDGFLTTSEIAALRLSAPLVVLSACQSLGGQVLGGEGLRGLAEPLFEAGARAIVVTHWSIGDRSVLPFVDRFYAAMARGRAVGDALRETKLAAIHDGARISDWAAFTVIGDASMHPSLKPRRLSPLNWLRDLAQPMRDTSRVP